MPSTLLSAASGAPFIVFSGNLWSGQGYPHPVGSIHFRLDIAASGSAYLCLSGGGTVKSGGLPFSGGGLLDGMQMAPGASYIIPRLGFATSGVLTVYAACDPAASGVGRLYWEAF